MKRIQKEAEATLKAAEKEKKKLLNQYMKEQNLRKKFYNELEDLKGKVREPWLCTGGAFFSLVRWVVAATNVLCWHFLSVASGRRFVFSAACVPSTRKRRQMAMSSALI